MNGRGCRAQRECKAFFQCRGQVQVVVAGPEILGVLHVERELRPDEQDQPRQIQPHQRDYHDGEAGIDRDGLGRECATKEAKIAPLAAQITPAVSPPTKAALDADFGIRDRTRT